MYRLLVFIMTYNAQRHITHVFDRIPKEIWHHPDRQVLLIDDASEDDTLNTARTYATEKNYPITFLKNKHNQCYGGNQKLGYRYAIDHGFDAVVMLHGDGQYAPELLLELADPALKNTADVVLGSRMMHRKDALKGGMPLYKFLGNIALTNIQNWLLRSYLAEFHTGYRVYRVDALRRIPFEQNNNNFVFDTEILIQMLNNGMRIKEIPIPTFYGEEKSHVHVFRYSWDVMLATLRSRFNQFGVCHLSQFNYLDNSNIHYRNKLGFASTHRYVADRIKPSEHILDIGAGPGHVMAALQEKNCTVYCVDQEIQPRVAHYAKAYLKADIDEWDAAWPQQPITTIIMLDVLEHLKNSERLLHALRQRYGPHKVRVIITVPNIAFIGYRLYLLMGLFYVAPRGTMDKTHTRFFTFASLKRMLHEAGYSIDSAKGVPVPFPLLIRHQSFHRFLLRCNQLAIALSKTLFAYEIAMEATILPTPRQQLVMSESQLSHHDT